MKSSGCPFKCGDVCLWASKLANNKIVKPTEETCKICLKQQESSRTRKGHNYRRPHNVIKLAAIELSKDTGTDPNEVYSSLKSSETWKRCHIRELIANKSPYFKILTTVGFYECSLEDAERDWSKDGFLNYLAKNNNEQFIFPEGLNLSDKELSSKPLFFEAFDRFLKTKNDNLGDVLKAVNYPVWVDPIDDVKPNPCKKNCIITVCSGQVYEDMFEKIRDRYEAYAEKCDADFVILSGYTQGWWGLEKFRIKPFVEAYERTCFLDSDIIIKSNAPNIFNMVPEGQIGVHDDWPYLIHKPFNFLQWRDTERNSLVKSQVADENFDYATHDTLLNTGVVLTSKRHADIWTPMKKQFPGNHCDEQFWIEYLILKKDYEVCKLPFSMNCQYWTDVFHSVAGVKEYYFLHLATDGTGDEKEIVLEEVLEKYAN